MAWVRGLPTITAHLNRMISDCRWSCKRQRGWYRQRTEPLAVAHFEPVPSGPSLSGAIVTVARATKGRSGSVGEAHGLGRTSVASGWLDVFFFLAEKPV